MSGDNVVDFAREKHACWILILGTSGSGKSSFINSLAGDVAPIGAGLRTGTQRVRPYRWNPDRSYGASHNTVWLIDTPPVEAQITVYDGNGEAKSQKGWVLIIQYLIMLFNAGVRLSGIVWLQSTSSVRATGSTRYEFDVLYELAGRGAFSAICFVTVFRDRVPHRERVLREAEWVKTIFAQFIEHGSSQARLEWASHGPPISHVAAWDIVSRFLSQPCTTLKVQSEMLVDGCDFSDTCVGNALRYLPVNPFEIDTVSGYEVHPGSGFLRFDVSDTQLNAHMVFDSTNGTQSQRGAQLNVQAAAAPRLDTQFDIRTASDYARVPQKDHGARLETQDTVRPASSTKTHRKGAIVRDELMSGSAIIAIMGITGVGKSTFIQHFTKEEVPVSDGIESLTREITIYRCSAEGLPPFFLIDTPGFDDSFRSDADVLTQLANFLATMWTFKIKLTGIIYLHNISETRFAPAAARNLGMFRELCGSDALSNVVLATTFWDYISLKEGVDREHELRMDPNCWGEMAIRGSAIFRQDYGIFSGSRIISHLVDNRSKVVLALQSELVDQQRTLADTKAGIIVAKQLNALKRHHKLQMAQLKEKMISSVESRDAYWQAKLEADRTQHTVIAQQQFSSLQVTQDSSSSTSPCSRYYGPSTISGEAFAVLGDINTSNYQTFHLQNQIMVFGNVGDYQGATRGLHINESTDDQRKKEIARSFLRDFLST